MGEKILVSADALRQVLAALSGPAHIIRELQVTRNLDELMGTKKNPLNILVEEFNEWATNPPEPEDNTRKDAAEKIKELETRLANQEKHVRTARDHAEKCHSIMLGYLPKIVQLMALLKRARVDVNYSFQMNADLERHQVFTPEDSVPITEAADKYQEFLDEIDAALWVPPTEGEQS